MKTKKSSKGQAAVEFLTTYAWAFMVIICMIGALSYFGVLNPSNLLPNRCMFSTEFQCLDYVIDSSKSSIFLRLKNNVGEPIVANITAFSLDSSTPLSCYRDNETLESAQVWDVNITNCNFDSMGILPNTKEKIHFTLIYYTAASGNNYMHEVSGELYSMVS